MAQALLLDNYESDIEEQDRVRIRSLETFINLLENPAISDLDRDDFSRLFKRGLEILELNQDFVAREFKISRPTVSRWETGVSAPHVLGRKPVFDVFKQIAKSKLRHHRDY